MSAEVKRQQYTMLDLAKFLCALLVLCYHYFSEHGHLPILIEEALSLYAVAVALFMVVSGFLVFDKLEGIYDRDERWRCLCRQIVRILKIYLLWSVLYLIYRISKWDYSVITVIYVLSQLQRWIFVSTFHTIWFMPSLALGLLFTFGVIEKLPKYLVCILAMFFYLIGASNLTYAKFCVQIPGFSKLSIFVNTWLGESRGWLLYGFPLIMVGIAMVKLKSKRKAKRDGASDSYKSRWKMWMILSVVSILLMLVEALTLRHLVGSTGIDMTLMMPVTVFCILGFLLSIRLPEGKYLIWMRKMSVLIFMSQRIFLTVIPDILPQPIMERIYSNQYFGAFVICGGTILFSAGVILCSDKVKWLKNLY